LQTGPRALAGQIRRGRGEAIAAVLWWSDLRDFTKLSDHVAVSVIVLILSFRGFGDRAWCGFSLVGSPLCTP
jgi:hypothetical protein